MKVYEKVDDLAGYGELMCNTHEIVELHFVDQPDWLRHRQYIIDHQDRILGESVIEALKRGWTASHFDRVMWSDIDRETWASLPDWAKTQYSIFRPDDDRPRFLYGYHIVASFLITRKDPTKETGDG